MNTQVDTQERILNSARELFYARSYADVGVADICQHAGVKKGSFYHFYPSKQALTLAVLDAYFVDLKVNLIDEAFAQDVPPMARLARFTELAYVFQKQIKDASGQVFGCPFGNMSSELATQDEPIRKQIALAFRKLHKLFCLVLKEAQAQSEIPANVDIEATAQAMLAYFEGVLLLAKNQNDAEVIKHLLPAMPQIRIAKP